MLTLSQIFKGRFGFAHHVTEKWLQPTTTLLKNKEKENER